MTSYYVVHKGKIPGIYKTWKDCKEQVNNYEGALFKKFSNKLDAEKFLKDGFGENHKPKCIVRKKNEDIHNEERVEKELQDSENKIFIYTDGSCIKYKNNLSKAGYGIYIPIKNIRVAAPLLNQKITNNRAELTAIIKSIDYLDDNDISKKICILTDSQYSMYLFNGTGERYEGDNYKMDGKEVPNKDLIQKLLEIKRNYNIILLKIRAHTNKTDIHSLSNKIADQLANEGAHMINSEKNIFSEKSFNLDEDIKNSYINKEIKMNELFESGEGEIKNLKNSKLSKWFIKNKG